MSKLAASAVSLGSQDIHNFHCTAVQKRQITKMFVIFSSSYVCVQTWFLIYSALCKIIFYTCGGEFQGWWTSGVVNVIFSVSPKSPFSLLPRNLFVLPNGFLQLRFRPLRIKFSLTCPHFKLTFFVNRYA